MPKIYNYLEFTIYVVSIKMNMLLYAPGIFLLLLMSHGIKGAAECISICAFVQLVLGFPFLITYPIQYMKRSFDLGRVFMYKWTVNLKFLPEDIFTSKPVSIMLLLLTILGNIYFLCVFKIGKLIVLSDFDS